MSLEDWQYPLYWPRYISGYEEVKMTTMPLTSMTETEQRIRMRYVFALSAFSRMFQPDRVTSEMKDLCKTWSEDIEEVPTHWDLYEVDRYFLELWKSRSSSS